jgi:hypothetical protein
MVDLDKTDPTFVDDLVASFDAVFEGAKWVHSKGYNVLIPKMRVRDKVENRMDFSDDGDFLYRKELGHAWRTGEVKERGIQFKSGSFPFPTIIVDVAHKKVADLYLIYSSDRACVAIIKGDTSDRWSLTKRYDARIGREREYVEAPLDAVRFVNL